MQLLKKAKMTDVSQRCQSAHVRVIITQELYYLLHFLLPTVLRFRAFIIEMQRQLKKYFLLIHKNRKHHSIGCSGAQLAFSGKAKLLFFSEVFSFHSSSLLFSSVFSHILCFLLLPPEPLTHLTRHDHIFLFQTRTIHQMI